MLCISNLDIAGRRLFLGFETYWCVFCAPFILLGFIFLTEHIIMTH